MCVVRRKEEDRAAEMQQVLSTLHKIRLQYFEERKRLLERQKDELVPKVPIRLCHAMCWPDSQPLDSQPTMQVLVVECTKKRRRMPKRLRDRFGVCVLRG